MPLTSDHKRTFSVRPSVGSPVAVYEVLVPPVPTRLEEPTPVRPIHIPYCVAVPAVHWNVTVEEQHANGIHKMNSSRSSFWTLRANDFHLAQPFSRDQQVVPVRQMHHAQERGAWHVRQRICRVFRSARSPKHVSLCSFGRQVVPADSPASSARTAPRR